MPKPSAHPDPPNPAHPPKLALTVEELIILSEFVCDRYDNLVQIAQDPAITSGEFRRGARRDAAILEELSAKLRPFRALRRAR